MNNEQSEDEKATLPSNDGGHLKTLTLDLGTFLGFAVLEGGEVVQSGTLELATEAELEVQRKEGKERTLDVRFTRLCQFIQGKIAAGVTRIVFEDVTFSRSTMQTQLWSSLRAAIWAVAQDYRVEVFCIHTGTLKSFATGAGGANKPQMGQALAQAEPARCTLAGEITLFKGRVADDNEVDAIWLARYAIAVDRGEQQFLSTYQRQGIRREEKQRKRRELRAARKARRQAEQAVAKARREQVKAAIKAAGRCCGVLRQPSSFGRAKCGKCGKVIKLQTGPILAPDVVTEASQADRTIATVG